jgi:hypothetical protein
MCDKRETCENKMTTSTGGGGGGGDMRDTWDNKMNKGPNNRNQLVWEREREREREIPPSLRPSLPPTFTPSLLSRDPSLHWKEERERARDSSLGAIIHHRESGDTNSGVQVTKPGRQVTLPGGLGREGRSESFHGVTIQNKEEEEDLFKAREEVMAYGSALRGEGASEGAAAWGAKSRSSSCPPWWCAGVAVDEGKGRRQGEEADACSHIVTLSAVRLSEGKGRAAVVAVADVGGGGEGGGLVPWTGACCDCGGGGGDGDGVGGVEGGVVCSGGDPCDDAEMQRKDGGVKRGGEGRGGRREGALFSRVLVQRNAAGNMAYVFR